MTIRRLRTLVAIADAKTFSAAAEIVHVTHAAVSQQMQSLEVDLGLTLFDRSTRTPELTPQAIKLVARARQLILDYDALAPSVLGEEDLGGLVRLGALRTTLTGLTPLAMARLKSKYPKLGLRIRPGLTSELLSDVGRGDLDAAIVTKPHLLPVGLAFEELAQEPMQLIAAQEEAERDPLVLLRNRPFIRFNRNAVLGTLIENWILSKRVRVSETMELDSPEAITSMVQANLGVSILPKPAVAPHEGVGVIAIDLGEDAPRRVLGLAFREKAAKQQIIAELLAVLRNTIKEGGRFK